MNTMNDVVTQPLKYEVHLVHGPYDGLVTVVEAGSFVDRETLNLPARPWNQDEGIAGLIENTLTRSIYFRVERQDNHGHSDGTIATVKYGFSTFEPPPARPPGRAAQLLRAAWQRFASWMASPVDYPLKMPVRADSDDQLG